jgi:hypothetical protein
MNRRSRAEEWEGEWEGKRNTRIDVGSGEEEAAVATVEVDIPVYGDGVKVTDVAAQLKTYYFNSIDIAGLVCGNF